MGAADSVYNTANRDRHTRSGFIARWHLRSVNEAIYQLVSESGARSVLDAGCGEGFVTDYLARRDPSLALTGIDVSSEAIDYARKNFGHASFLVGSVLALPFGDASYDTVLCSEVLEHIPDWEQAITELKRVARHYVLITVPREPHFKVLNSLGRATRFCQDPGHINFWSWASFKRIISARFSGTRFERKHVIYQLALGRV